MDDIPLVEKNSYLTEWHSVGSYLSQEDGYNKDSGGHTGYYRPFINLSYTLDYKIWGMFAPGFRITNLVIHLFTCFSLFSFFNLILKEKKITFILVLIFALHPVNTETVSWVTSRNNILVTLFGILSLIFYIRAYQNRKYYEYILSIIFFAFSIFSKEFGLMLLPIFFLYQRAFHSGAKFNFIELREYIPFVLVAGIYFFFRQNVIGSLITPADFSDIFTRVYNAPYVLFFNLKLIFLPYQLHSFYIKYPEGFLNPVSIMCIFLLVALILLMWVFRKNRIFIFSIISFSILLFPVLNILPTSAPYLIAMRWLYFPMPFLLLVLALPLKKFYIWNYRITLFLLAGVILYLGINTYTLNRFLWHSVEIFFKQEVENFNNVFYYDGMGIIYGKEKKFDMAIKLHKKSIDEGIRLNVNYIECAELLMDKGYTEKAMEYLDKASSVCFSNEELGRILNDKGVGYMKLKRLNEAEKNIRKAIILAPEEPIYWENLGVALGNMGRHQEAIESFKKAIRLGVDSKTIYVNMVNGYISNNECKKAIDLIKRITRDEKDAELNRLLKKAERCLTGENT